MSILLAAVLLASPAQAAAPPPPAEAEMVVIGQRMRRLKLVTKTDRKTGLRRCVFRRRSGDPAFDTLMCDASLACGATATTSREMELCVGPRIEAYAATLAAQRETMRASPAR